MNKSPASSKASELHELKTDPAVFAAVLRGAKTHEIRFNDRNFKVGDDLLLRETAHSGAEMAARPDIPLVYTDRTVRRTISHIQTGYGLADGWCILSFAPLAAEAPDAEAAPPTIKESLNVDRAEAALPVAAAPEIKRWPDRLPAGATADAVNDAMQAEIADLRAALQQRQAPADVSASGLLKLWHQAEESATNTMPAPFQFAKLLLASRPVSPGPTATHGPLSLTNRKTADIATRGYNIVGYVLRREDGEEVCISAESAVRWLPQANYWRLMHEQDGSLFAQAEAAPVASAEPVAYMIRDKREFAGHPDWSKWKPCSVEEYELRKEHTDIFEFRALTDAAPAPEAAPVAPDALPPLPEPLTLGWTGGDSNRLPRGYTADQMHDYARAALSSQHQTNQGDER